jgi:hypothetical protein
MYTSISHDFHMIGEKCRRDAMWLGKRTLVVSMLIKHPVHVTLTIDDYVVHDDVDHFMVGQWHCPLSIVGK